MRFADQLSSGIVVNGPLYLSRADDRPAAVGRMRRSIQWCAADPGPMRQLSHGSRVCAAPLRATSRRDDRWWAVPKTTSPYMNRIAVLSPIAQRDRGDACREVEAGLALDAERLQRDLLVGAAD